MSRDRFFRWWWRVTLGKHCLPRNVATSQRSRPRTPQSFSCTSLFCTCPNLGQVFLFGCGSIESSEPQRAMASLAHPKISTPFPPLHFSVSGQDAVKWGGPYVTSTLNTVNHTFSTTWLWAQSHKLGRNPGNTPRGSIWACRGSVLALDTARHWSQLMRLGWACCGHLPPCAWQSPQWQLEAHGCGGFTPWRQ